jgi:hypothetical protein
MIIDASLPSLVTSFVYTFFSLLLSAGVNLDGIGGLLSFANHDTRTGSIHSLHIHAYIISFNHIICFNNSYAFLS